MLLLSLMILSTFSQDNIADISYFDETGQTHTLHFKYFLKPSKS